MAETAHDIPADLRAKLNATMDQVLPACVHFYWQRPSETPKSLGSGILLKLNDDRLRVATAFHVFDGDGRGPGGGLAMGGPRSALIPLKGNPARTYSVQPDGEDVIDLASFWLDGRSVAELGQVTPFTGSDVQASTSHDPSRRYAVVGFPASKNKKPVGKGEPLPGGMMMFVARERDPGLPLPRPWINPAHHLMLSWDSKTAFHSEYGQHNPPKLSGVSGGVVLDLGPTLDPRVRPKVAGIFTRHLKPEDVLVATRLHPFLSLHESDKPK